MPGKTPFTESFSRLYSDQAKDPRRWRRSQHYAASTDWRDCGIDVLLHMECTMTRDRMHKIEIFETGDKTYGEMVTLCQRVFDIDAEKLGIMRVDLTADIPDVPVDWFKRHTIVKGKQTRRELGTVAPYQTVRKGRAETLYAGVKPNQIRIYDKGAERRMQYARYLNKTVPMLADIPGAEPSTFEAIYGHDINAVVTRVERQVGARDVEKMGFSNLRSLLRAADLDPFEKMVFFDSNRFDERVEDWGFRNWLAGMHLRQRVEEFGRSATEQWMRAHVGDHNFVREKKKWAPFLALNDNVVGIDALRLRHSFQASSYRQLRAA